MKPGTMYQTTDGRRFTLVKITETIGKGPNTLDVWAVADVETGAITGLDEDEIFAADEGQAQVGQAWIDGDCLVTLTSCWRNGRGAWVWDAIESGVFDREIAEENLFRYYARVDGLDPSTLNTEGKEVRV
jgi:hypothetical protein